MPTSPSTDHSTIVDLQATGTEGLPIMGQVMFGSRELFESFRLKTKTCLAKGSDRVDDVVCMQGLMVWGGSWVLTWARACGNRSVRILQSTLCGWRTVFIRGRMHRNFVRGGSPAYRYYLLVLSCLHCLSYDSSSYYTTTTTTSRWRRSRGDG